MYMTLFIDCVIGHFTCGFYKDIIKVAKRERLIKKKRGKSAEILMWAACILRFLRFFSSLPQFQKIAGHRKKGKMASFLRGGREAGNVKREEREGRKVGRDVKKEMGREGGRKVGKEVGREGGKERG